ncbi:MAG TPA: amino acid adenylation domain-containing protein, partial [Thermoanaerobaculia bacterium]|nr:amino acid adenylation domain-containing protein [Thermoanaerobaculia bacterium]
MSDRTGLEIAVIGVAGRFPGAADVEVFWRNLCGGIESIASFSREELLAAGLDPAIVNHPSFVPSRGALEGVDLFDAALFDLSPREAEILDPQHRLFLECAWEALENAGWDPLQAEGLIGVYGGAGPNTYLMHLLSRPDLVAAMGNFQLTLASEKDYLATRTSFKLGLRGPSVVVQTACSTSLVAIHMACQSLLAGECHMALAGGVRVVSLERSGYFFREGSIDSPDGHCRAFDAQARGTVSGSGVGVVVLKRLEDALAEGDRILAVIKGSAVNNDGSLKVGYTAPSIEGQVAVVRMAQSIAEVAPETVGYIEAHGTGTELGDPVEIAALTRAFGITARGTCAIGSVKTNIGHLDAAAGVAGLIKTLLAVERGLIPPSLHCEQPNPEIGFDATPFYVSSRLETWKRGGPRRAGVSSFGIGGTNAHVVLEEPPAQPPSCPGRPWQLLVLSAKTATALERRARDLAEHLRSHPQEDLADVAFTCHLGRRRLAHRRIAVCRDAQEAAAALGSGDPQRTLGRVQEASDRPVAFLFPGQGCQHVGMAQGLYRSEPAFAEQLDRCAEILAAHLGLDLRRVLYPAPEEAAAAGRALERTALAQPAIFAFEYSLARLWMDWGVRPRAMLGHSIGEFVAACLAGVMELEDALALVAARGRLMQELPEGAMLAVPMGEGEVAPLLEESLSVAAVNGPRHCVAAGPVAAVERLQQELAGRGLEVRRLHTSHAFHSSLMDPACEPFRDRVRAVRLAPPQIPYLSNLTGSWVSADQATDPVAWARHLREPVRFGDALETLLEIPDLVLVEVGPGRTLTTLVKSHPAWSRSPDVIRSLGHPGERGDDVELLLTAVGRLWLAGAPVDGKGLYRGQRRRRLALPAYPFERRRFWVDPAAKAGSLPAAPMAEAMAVAAGAGESLAPAPAQGHARPELETVYVAPRSAVEETLAGIWQTLLGIQRIGVHDDFFELGGHSLLMTQAVAHVERSLGLAVSLRALFESPTVARQAELLERLRAEAGSGVPSSGLPAIEPDSERLSESFPLTDVQRAYWIGRTDAVELGNVATHTYTELDVAGLDLGRLEGALQRLIDRQHMLRAIVLPDGRQQILASVPPYRIRTLDLTGSSAERTREALAEVRDEMSHQVLPSDRWPLFELRASCLAGGKVRLHFSFDFLLGDAWSFRVLFTELGRFYADLQTEMAPLELSFRDYVLAEQALAGTELHRRSLEYWRSRLATLPPAPELPLARNPAQILRPRFARRAHRLGSARWEGLKKRAARFGLTPSGVLLAAFGEALARWSKSPRFTLNLTLFNRLPLHSQVNQLIGDFTSLTLLEVDGSGEEPFVDRARRLQSRLLEDLDHRYVSGVRVLRELALLQGRGHGGAMPVVFTSLLGLTVADGRATDPSGELARLEGEVVYSISQTPQVWLDHQAAEADGDLSFNWDVVEELFPEGLIDAVFAGYCRLLDRLADGEDAWRETSPLPLLSGRPALTAPDLAPAGETLHGLFLAQALRRPDRTAVVSRDGSLTYGELDRLSSGIAARLRRLGARPGRLVAVVMEKGCEQVAAVLGVLRSGAAYLPVDPALPRERRWHLLRYGEAQVALTQPWLDESPEWPEGVERVAVSLAEDGPAESEPPPPVASAEDLAYVIFTSGSTGLPKGVMIDHRGAVNTILDINRRFGVGPDDRVLAVSSLSFDLSVYDIFGLLAAGGTVVMPDASQGPDPEGWCRWMARERVTLWNSVPALMEILTESPGAARGMPGAVRLVLLSGDWIPLPLPARIGELAPDAEVVSLGGATEASIWSILHPIADVDPAWKSIPYGRAMARQSVQVLDSRLEPRPVWVPGDLYIGGIGLAQGYWRDEEKTRASFIRHPRTGERLYRTGDLGRYLPGGVIEFLGREDHQVKIGGHRIELGEIEAGLGEHPDVQSCVVTTSGQARGARRLVAYVVPEPAGEGAGADALERFLRARLPAYMVPVAFVVLPALPLTPNGKVDRRALPEPESPQPTGSARPRSPVEEALAGIWANVLGLDGVGIHDDFFALGGDSLQATRVIARIRDTLDAELALRQLFETPTVAGLAVRIEEAQRQRAVPRLPPIMRVLERDRLPLSFGQERLWFLDRLEPGNPAYNLPGAVQLSGTLDRAALAASLSEIVRRHEVLRTTFVPTGEGPVQVIAPPASEGLPLPLVDVSALAPGEREREARRIAREEAASPFDLRCGPVRARLLRFAPHDHAVLWNTHHIVSDGWSGMVFLRELAALYAAYARRLPSPLADPPIQYGDYAVWQRAWLQGRTLEDLLADWRGRLAGAPSALVLPTDRPRPPVLSSRGGYRTFRLSAEVAGRLGALARSEGATTFMVLAAGLAALLRRYSGQDDVLIGTPIANRSQVEVEDLIGFFANTLVLRLDLAGDPGFRELLVRSREVALWAYARQALPFEKLVEAVQPERSLARAPLFQVLFVLQNAGSPAVELPGLELRPLPVDLAATKLDLTLTLTEAADGVLATLEFSADLFDASTIERMAGHFCRLVAEAVDDPQRPVSELPLLTGPERQLLIEWNDTSRAYGVEVWIQEMFEERAAAAPDAVAVVFESTFVSYGALSRRSNHLAQRLVSLGVGPDVAVGVCAERSPALMIALLAVLKAGGAYLPLDPDYPQDRLAFMLDDARASVLLAQESLLHCLPPRQAPVLLLDALPGEAAGAPVRPVDGAHLAYVLYTSGSTGRPKGVMVPHVGIRNRLLWMQEAYRLTAGDRVLQKTPFSFDVSVWELFWPLLAGARLVLARPGGHRDSVYLADLIADQGGTVIHFVPSMLRVFVEEPRAAGCHSLRAVVCSGEALPPDLRDRALALLPGAGLYNLYGPTEASVDITAWTCDRAAAGRIVPIGRPIANSSVHVLDAQFRPQPVGVPGELCLGGVQLARGYLSRPDLTAERFVPDPCDAKGQRPGARLYRTGDLARWLPDGAVEFLGRLDHQVKVRGFRIELGEIEAVLLQHPAIHEAVVVAHREGEDTRLAAYFVAAGELQVRTLREHLAAHLPAFMVPSWLIALPYLPLSSNGKLDRKALPAPGRTALPPAERVAPRNGIEEVVASIWSSVLGVGQVGVKDDFFVLGGHSLAAGRVVSQLREIFAVEVPLRRFFEAPTVEGIAGEVSGLVSAGRRSVAPRIERVARDGPLPLSFAQERLWFLHVLQPASPAYNIPLAVR